MTDAPAPDLRAAARELADNGLCVLPIKADGTKAPALRSWTPYKTARSTRAEHDQWFNGGQERGLAVVYGAVSGNVELIEFEGLAIREGLYEQAAEIMAGSGLGDIWQVLTTGWVTRSPSGGLHLRARITGRPVPPNTKLASRLAREDEYTDIERQRLAEKPGARIIRGLVETRGEGGYGLVEPSSGTVHATGLPYERIAGGPATIPTIDADHMDAVRLVFRTLDALPPAESVKASPRELPPLPEGRLRPGEDYEARTDWADILQPEGWTYITQHGRTRYWRRPGKDRGLSATTGHAEDRDRLYVFTSSTEFTPETPYTKFGAYALLHHAGNHTAAARALRSQGFGSEPPHRRLNAVPGPRQGEQAPPVDGTAALNPHPGPTAPASEPPALHVVPPARPVINISNEADAIDELLNVMGTGQLPDLYKRSGGPCWVYTDDQGNPLVRQLGTENLRAYLAEHVTTYQVVKDPATDGTKEVRELFMPKTCATILGRRDWPLQPLRGIVTAPVVRPDATILATPGYDQATGLYMHPRVPLRRLGDLTAEAVQRAKQIVLGQMLADFPFVDDSDLAHYMGALFAPIIRPYVPGPTPMLLITSNSPGSGKTLLTDIPRQTFGLAATPWPENDAELRKALTATLWDRGDPYVCLDNLPNGHVIKSPILSSLLTSHTWSDRLLGASSSVSVPNDRMWILNGNNLRTGGDNRRRTLWCRLDPDCPDPDQRDNFVIGDLRAWLDDNASTVVAALVTLVRSWLAAGAPRVNVRMGDYSRWASVVAGILAHLGIPGWLANRGQNDGLDDEVQEWAAFLTTWHAVFGDRAVPGKDLLALDEVPQPLTGEKPSAKQLGHWLKAREGRYFEDLKIVRVYDSHRKTNFWRVVKHEAAGS